jgi:hypothetical protein
MSVVNKSMATSAITNLLHQRTSSKGSNKGGIATEKKKSESIKGS